jgi:hypothetical protein
VGIKMKIKSKCSVPDCDKHVQAKGLCHKHYMRKWYEDHPEEREKSRIRMNAVPKEVSRERRFRHHYGVDLAWYNAKFVEQNGLCAICNQLEHCMIKGKLLRLAVDHCHDTGKARALLCRDCNQAIGLLKHSPVIAEAASNYLKQHA